MSTFAGIALLRCKQQKIIKGSTRVNKGIYIIDARGVVSYLRGTSMFLPMVGWLVVVGGVGSFASGGNGFPGAMRCIEPHLYEPRLSRSMSVTVFDDVNGVLSLSV